MAEIRFINATLEEEGDKIVLQGRIDPAYLHALQIDLAYQRQELTGSVVNRLAWDIEAGAVLPPLMIGVRGQSYELRDGFHFITSPAFLIDGQQRRAGVIKAMAETPGIAPMLHAVAYFDTDVKWEGEHFLLWNSKGVRVAPSVFFKTLKARDGAGALDTLYALTLDRSFALGHRVAWEQRAAASDLVSGLTYLRIIGRLHHHLGLGRAVAVEEVAAFIRVLGDRTGIGQLRDNARVFFETLDRIWGVRQHDRRAGGVHLKNGALSAIADVFSGHMDFWNDNALFVDIDDIRKLQKFDFTKPDIRPLAVSGQSSAVTRLATHLVNHINSGRRTGRLTPRAPVRWSPSRVDQAAE